MQSPESKVDTAAMNRAIDKVLAYGSPKPASEKRPPQPNPKRKKQKRLAKA